MDKPRIPRPRKHSHVRREQHDAFWAYVDSVQADESGVKVLDVEHISKMLKVTEGLARGLARQAGYVFYRRKDLLAYREEGVTND
jgi:hypothetical protein